MEYAGLLIPVGIAVGGGVLAYYVARRLSGAVLSLLWAALVLFSGLMFGMAESTPGWDALTYLVIFYGACAPAGVGMLIGSIIGWVHRDPPAQDGDTEEKPR